MKSLKLFHGGGRRKAWVAWLGLWAAAGKVLAADTNAPATLTPQQFFEGGEKSYDNWVDFSFGGLINNGNQAELQRSRQMPVGAFGGINDFHYQTDIAKNTTLSLDGRALIDDRDYSFKMNLEREKLGFLRFSYSEFRTWYNGNGGFYPPTGTWYPLPNADLALDRGQLSLEGGLRLQKKDVPDITFKYTHDFREGDKSSTVWGGAHPAIGVTQGLSSSFYDINEHSDSFQLDATHHIKATEFGAGLRYDTGKLDNALKIDQFPGEPVEQKITDRQTTTYDMFNARAFTETWVKKDVMFSTGFLYSDLDNKLTGSRIYGSDFDVGYVPGVLAGSGYYNLSGDSRLHEYVADLNLFYKPTQHFSIVPSVRVEQENTEASDSGQQTLGVNAPAPFSANSDLSDLDVRERLDLTYNGLTNWVFYARGDLAQGSGKLNENGGLGPVGGIGVPPIQLQSEENRFFQKYSGGVRWYPLRAVSLDLGGYYKDNSYNYSFNTDSTPNNSADRYPGYLVMQGFRTYDGNSRITFRPRNNVTLTGRYEYQLSTIETRPDPISGLSGIQTSKMTSHILAGDVIWVPWSRLSLEGGINYVLSKTITPASDATQAILNAQNNYLVLNLSSGFVVDDKTDLNLAFFYYRANDYRDISSAGVPYGAGAEDDGVTATLIRRLTKNIRVSLKYGCFNGHDAPSGGNNNYASQFIYSTLQYRF